MAVECRAAQAGKWRSIVVLGIVVVFAVLCYYDGWISDKYKDEPWNLLFNQIASIVLTVVTIFLIIRLRAFLKTHIVADQTGLNINDKLKISWSELTNIDYTYIEKGLVDIYYLKDGKERKWTADSYKIDHFDELMDEISKYRPDLLPPAEEEKSEAEGDRDASSNS